MPIYSSRHPTGHDFIGISWICEIRADIPNSESLGAMAEVRLTVGNVEILVMHDAEAALPLEMTFPDVSAEA
jgi:hypothetical protein